MAVSAQPLSPWPTTGTPTQRANAIARIKEAVAGATLDSDERACGLGEAAAALVEKEASGAPQAVKDEAVIRFVGYLAQSDFGGVRAEQVGDIRFEHAPNHGIAFRHCGAKALLGPWKVRRAGAIG